MTKRQRVMAALGGETVDRVPLAFWMHDFAGENSAAGLASETLRLARAFDWDWLKPQSRAQCFAEMWGLTYRPSGARATPYTVIHHPARGAADLARLRPADPAAGALGEQLEALRAIRAAVGPDTPVVWTVFAPLMVLAYLLPGGRDQALALLRSDPGPVTHALGVMTDTLAVYARACLTAGADGLFYATNVATRALLTPAECRRFQRPWDLRVLEAAAGARFNILHLCGDDIRLDEFTNYPVAAFSLAAGGENPSLAEVHRRTGRAIVGGLPPKPDFATLTPEAVATLTRAAMAAMDGRWLLLAPGCSIEPDAADALLQAAGDAARAGIPGGGKRR